MKIGPFRNALGLTINGQPSRNASVLLLLLRRCPLAVIGIVAFVGVLAINGHAFGAFAHVGNECLEGQPTVANGVAGQWSAGFSDAS